MDFYGLEPVTKDFEAFKNSDFNGSLDAKNLNIVIICGRFNSNISENLAVSCIDELNSLGLERSSITLIWVPGAFEMPLAARGAIKRFNPDAVICLGAVIKGDTDHYEYVSKTSAEGLAEVSRNSGVPVIYEVLAVRHLEDALKRSQKKSPTNKGIEAARAAVWMARLRDYLSYSE
jgi:6,7-dimethyl-8-ribityllumazine synthase